MTIVSINTIKNWFKTGMIPTQDQFWSVFDSFRHKDDKVPVADVEGINELLATRASQQVLDNHLAKKGAPNGYAPLDEFTKLAAQYLNIVNDLVTGGATALLSAEQGKVLQTQISAINTLLTSDNVNLDTVQELVDAIETVQLSLSSILVNDLTTGGTTKALTAEMGKQLDLIKESTANKSTSIVVDYLSNIKFPSVKAVYDFCMSAFKKKFLAFGDVAGIAHTFGVGSENTMFKFSNNNPITATIPTNATTPFEIGTVFETIAIGNGALTVTGAPGVTILTNLSNTSVKNEVRRYTKIDTDTWTVEGNIKIFSKKENTIFLSKLGDDFTASPTNSDRAFRTLDGCITWLNSQSHKGDGWFIEVQDNGVYTQNNSFTLSSLNILNNNEGTIVFGNMVSVSNTWTLASTYGTVVFDFKATPPYNGNTLIQSNSTFIDWIIRDLIFQSTSGFTSNGRGFFRSLGITGRIKVTTLTNNSPAPWGACFRDSKAEVVIGTLVNNGTGAGLNFFSSDIDGDYNNAISINNYINNTNSGNVLQFRNGCVLGNIQSNNAITYIQSAVVSLSSNVSLKNVLFSAYPLRINGNGYLITFNLTIQLPNGVYGNYLFGYLRPGRDPLAKFLNGLMFSDVTFNVVTTFPVLGLIGTDIRDSGDNGLQVVLDNFTLNAVNLPVIYYTNPITTAPSWQIIFRNSNRILNNTHLVKMSGAVTQRTDMIVKDGGAIYHDFQVIGDSPSIQTTIPSINTY